VPAAAVIPAPIAYIKVVAVKKLVVEVLVGCVSGFTPSRGLTIRRRTLVVLNWSLEGTGTLL
jgi:hypothetical protein